VAVLSEDKAGIIAVGRRVLIPEKFADPTEAL
jgi:hypothetical protein